MIVCICERHLSCGNTEMSEEEKPSPYRRHDNDLEAGINEFEEEEDSGPFDILRTKSASVDRLKRWRVSSVHLRFE